MCAKKKSTQAILIQSAPKDLRAAVAAGISSGKGIPSGEVFERLETKYRNQAKE